MYEGLIQCNYCAINKRFFTITRRGFRRKIRRLREAHREWCPDPGVRNV